MEGESRGKATYDAMKALAVKSTAQYFGITESYVRICLKKNRNGKTDSIRSFFLEKYEALQQVLR